MWSLTAPVIPGAGALGLIAGTQSNGGYFLSFEPPDSAVPEHDTTNTTTDCPRINDTTPSRGPDPARRSNGKWTGTGDHRVRLPVAELHRRRRAAARTSRTPRRRATSSRTDSTLRYRVEVTATNPAPTFDLVQRYSAITSAAGRQSGELPGQQPGATRRPSASRPRGTRPRPRSATRCTPSTAQDPPATTDGWFNPRRDQHGPSSGCAATAAAPTATRSPGPRAARYTLVAADGTHDLKVRVTGTNAVGFPPAHLERLLRRDLRTRGDRRPDPGPGRRPGACPRRRRWPARPTSARRSPARVGGWKDPTTDFRRRWVRCDADGGVVHLHPEGREHRSGDRTRPTSCARTISATRCACAWRRTSTTTSRRTGSTTTCRTRSRSTRRRRPS